MNSCTDDGLGRGPQIAGAAERAQDSIGRRIVEMQGMLGSSVASIRPSPHARATALIDSLIELGFLQKSQLDYDNTKALLDAIAKHL